MLLVRLLDLWEAGASAPQNCLPGGPRPFAAPGCLCAGMASCSHESPRGGDRLWAHSRKRAAAEGGSRRLHDKQLVAVATAGARGGLRRSGMALETRVTAAGRHDVQAPHSPKHTAHSCLHRSRFSCLPHGASVSTFPYSLVFPGLCAPRWSCWFTTLFLC